MLKVLEIEDHSDCDACVARDEDQWDMIREVQIETLGEAICQECGRSYTVVIPKESPDA